MKMKNKKKGRRISFGVELQGIRKREQVRESEREVERWKDL